MKLVGAIVAQGNRIASVNSLKTQYELVISKMLP
jgi:hypothetical protein